MPSYSIISFGIKVIYIFLILCAQISSKEYEILEVNRCSQYKTKAVVISASSLIGESSLLRLPPPCRKLTLKNLSLRTTSLLRLQLTQGSLEYRFRAPMAAGFPAVIRSLTHPTGWTRTRRLSGSNGNSLLGSIVSGIPTHGALRYSRVHPFSLLDGSLKAATPCPPSSRVARMLHQKKIKMLLLRSKSEKKKDELYFGSVFKSLYFPFLLLIYLWSIVCGNLWLLE